MTHPIALRRVVNGYVVGVGCMEFVFNSFDELVSELREYHDDPRAAEKKWLSTMEEQNLSLSTQPCAPEPTAPAYAGNARLPTQEAEAVDAPDPAPTYDSPTPGAPSVLGGGR